MITINGSTKMAKTGVLKRSTQMGSVFVLFFPNWTNIFLNKYKRSVRIFIRNDMNLVDILNEFG